MQSVIMNRNLYWSLTILCIAHAVLVTAALFGEWMRVCFLMIATASWFVWPIVMWLIRARKWSLALPLLIGFVTVFPSAGICLIWFLVGFPYMIQDMTAKRFIGHGDAGQSILQNVEKYGGVPKATNGLPRISVQWSYTEYNDGTTTIRLPVHTFPDVKRLLKQSLGPPQGWGASGWNIEYELSTNGANIEVYGGEITDFEYTDLVFSWHRPPTLSEMGPISHDYLNRLASLKRRR